MSDFATGANEDDHHYFGLNWTRDLPLPDLHDLRMPTPGDPAPNHPNAKLSVERGIEVGHIFALGKSYSTPMQAQFQDKNGRPSDFIMGCYGIGVSRLVAAAIEQSHDEKGIIWPTPLAPFTAIIIALNYEKSPQVKTQADNLYNTLQEAGIDTALDDRPLRPGEKFTDAELLGYPHQITIGDKSLAKGIIEYKTRRDGKMEQWPVDEGATRLRQILGG